MGTLNKVLHSSRYQHHKYYICGIINIASVTDRIIMYILSDA